MNKTVPASPQVWDGYNGQQLGMALRQDEISRPLSHLGGRGRSYKACQ